MDLAGLIFDDSPHYLDHLAPFCAWVGCPLIVCEPHLGLLVKRFYKEVELIETPFHRLTLPKKTMACESPPFLRATFPFQKSTFFWLPHGNSDKGYSHNIFSSLEGENAFVYGQKMVDFMREKKVKANTIEVGNFRFEYFKKKIENTFVEENSFLYAPTWDDEEGSNSFWKSFSPLARNLPEKSTLYVRLHPNTLKKFAPEIEMQRARFDSRKKVIFLDSESPIYPLLAKMSSYIGDMSSIGYDFLTFNRAMFFLNAKPFLPLHQCGEAIDAPFFDYQSKKDFSEQRKRLYEYTFSSKKEILL